MQQEFLFTQSQYYHNSLNTAIFADPVRIYFNNSYEALCLKLYHRLNSDPRVQKVDHKMTYLLVYGENSEYAHLINQKEPLTSFVDESGHAVVVCLAEKLEDAYQDIINSLEGIS